MATTDRVLVLLQIGREARRVARFDDVHPVSIERFNRLVDRTLLLVVVSVAKPATDENPKTQRFGTYALHGHSK